MRNLLTPIISMAILTLGNGFFTTLTTVQLHDASWSNWTIGLVSAMYFLGLTVGAIFSCRLVTRVGHLRAYAVYAAVMAIVILMQGLLLDIWLWMALRFITGYVLAGLFIVIESWVLDASSEEKQGAGFAIYLFAYYFAQSIGQLFMGIHFPCVLQAFVLISILVTASIIPVSSTRVVVPFPKKPKLGSWQILWRKAKLAVVGSVVSGATIGASYAIYPLYLAETGQGKASIGYVMGILILGATLLQYPIGWLSDRFDRRLIILGVSGSAVLMSVFLMLWHQNFVALLILTFLLGGFVFTLYPLSISNASDNLPAKMTLSLIAFMTFLYGIGTFVGPMLATLLMHMFGANGFFVLIGVFCAGVGCYSVARLCRRPAHNHGHFVGTVIGKPVNSDDMIEKNQDG